MTQNNMVDSYRRSIAELNKKDVASLSGCYAETGSVRLIDDETYSGPKGIEQFYRPLFEAFPDLEIEPQVILVNGARLASVDLIKGTHRGNFFGHAGTGKRIGLIGARYIDCRADGRFERDTFFYDPRTILGQIGASAAKHRPMRTEGLAQKEVVVATGAPQEKEHAHLANRQVAIFTTHNREAFVPTLQPDGIVANNTQDHDAEGSEAIGDHVQAFHVAFPNSLAIPTDFWGAGEWAVSMVEFSGLNVGRLMSGLPATNREVCVNLLEIRKFSKKKVWREWIFLNGVAMSKQLGLM